MKFTDYNASYITPQETLLKKFTALIKWLKENSDQYFQSVFEVKAEYVSGTNIARNLIEENPNKVCKEGDLLIFQNCYYTFVSAIGSDKIYFDTPVNFKGEKGDDGNEVKFYKHSLVLWEVGSTSDHEIFLISLKEDAYESIEDIIDDDTILTATGNVIYEDILDEGSVYNYKVFKTKSPKKLFWSDFTFESGEDVATHIYELETVVSDTVVEVM